MVLDINADILWYQCFLFKLVSVGYKFLLSKPIFRFPSVAIFVRRHRNTAKFWLYLSLCTSTQKLVLQVVVKCKTCDCPQLFYQCENFCLPLYIMKVLQNPSAVPIKYAKTNSTYISNWSSTSAPSCASIKAHPTVQPQELDINGTNCYKCIELYPILSLHTEPTTCKR